METTLDVTEHGGIHEREAIPPTNTSEGKKDKIRVVALDVTEHGGIHETEAIPPPTLARGRRNKTRVVVSPIETRLGGAKRRHASYCQLYGNVDIREVISSIKVVLERQAAKDRKSKNNCFLCGELHFCRDCQKGREELLAHIKEYEERQRLWEEPTISKPEEDSTSTKVDGSKETLEVLEDFKDLVSLESPKGFPPEGEVDHSIGLEMSAKILATAPDRVAFPDLSKILPPKREVDHSIGLELRATIPAVVTTKSSEAFREAIPPTNTSEGKKDKIRVVALDVTEHGGIHETEAIPPTNTSEGKKDKTRVVVSPIETRFTRVDVTMADSGERLDIGEHCIEHKVGDLKGRLGEPRGDMLATVNSMVHVGHQEKLSFQLKVLDKGKHKDRKSKNNCFCVVSFIFVETAQKGGVARAHQRVRGEATTLEEPTISKPEEDSTSTKVDGSKETLEVLEDFKEPRVPGVAKGISTRGGGGSLHRIGDECQDSGNGTRSRGFSRFVKDTSTQEGGGSLHRIGVEGHDSCRRYYQELGSF
ncbi:hypothetical protein Acr_29g0009070 [Actinidia rufa]|uniref:Uncharacterized protein n=1 Tax=Actinidia rufa TaxID=165716 RepID=A0A7J0HFK6_9ERIC|nr:hypothetical protein Acr_29g0009070 [Actinidia rufa]